MTETLRGPLLTAQREISALDIRRRVIAQKVNVTEQEEKGAYVNATNWQDTLQNTAKKAGYVSQHAKLKAEMGMVDVQIKDFKQVFGLELFAILMELEDTEGWLPTVRDIRSIYDQARRDIEKIQVRQKEKEAELIKLGGTPIVESAPSSTIETSPDDPNHGKGAAGSYFKQIAAVEAQQQSSTLPMAQAVPVGQESIRSIGGPLSYSIPSAVPATTTTLPSTTTAYPDPFGLSVPSTTTTTTTTTSNLSTASYPPPVIPQQQQQQQLPPLTAPINPMFAYNDATKAAATTANHSAMDPFAGMYSSSNNNNHAPNTSTGFGFMEASGGGNAAGMTFPSSLPSTTQYVDPFAAPSPVPLSSYHNNNNNVNININNHPASAFDQDDPFAMLSTTAVTTPSLPTFPSANPNNNSNNASQNPLFRYWVSVVWE